MAHGRCGGSYPRPKSRRSRERERKRRDVMLREQIGPELAPFLRWLIDSGDWTVRQVLDVLEDAHAWELEFAEYERETRQRATPEECGGEELADR